MRIVRRLFVVPLADNNHGKTTMLRALFNQATGRALDQPQKRTISSSVRGDV
jgi:hypothetical protein